MSKPKQCDDLMTVADVAACLGVHRSRVHQLVSTGRLPVLRLGRQWIFRRSDVERFAAEPRPSGLHRRPSGKYGWSAMRLGRWHCVVKIPAGAMVARVAAYNWARKRGLKAETRLANGVLEVKFSRERK